MTFGEKLRKLRADRKISQQELAQKAGLSQTAIYYWEKGERKPKIEQLRRIAAVLGVYIGDLVDDWENYSKEEIEADWGTLCVIAHEDAIKAGGYPLNELEKPLLDNYRRLNPSGQQKADNYVEDLTKIPEYTKKD